MITDIHEENETDNTKGKHEISLTHIYFNLENLVCVIIVNISAVVAWAIYYETSILGSVKIKYTKLEWQNRKPQWKTSI